MCPGSNTSCVIFLLLLGAQYTTLAIRLPWDCLLLQSWIAMGLLLLCLLWRHTLAGRGHEAY